VTKRPIRDQDHFLSAYPLNLIRLNDTFPDGNSWKSYGVIDNRKQEFNQWPLWTSYS